MGGYDGRCLAAGDVSRRADQFPHLLRGESTGWTRRSEGIPIPGSPPALSGASGFEISLSEAGGGYLRVCEGAT